ncbi:MAG: adenosylcobinamide-phosphate synthase CbiB [Clostridiales bacterium]|nr:adenosylcobinamide-phosphate synthase CbiB [Clostridiales bacterium]
MLINSGIALVLGFFLDCIFGDPHWLYHPVQAMGWLITFWEKTLRRIFPDNKKALRTAGVFLVILVIISSLSLPGLLLWGAYRLSRPLGILVETVFCYQMLAARSLQKESGRVAKALEEGLDQGRYAVSMIVGRDTERLSEEGVVKAAVETVAENTSDGIVAPMMFMAIGGGLLGYFYKAVNTMDSMVGYRNEKYQYLGTAAAKLDDLCNWIPARISAWLMIGASWILGMDSKQAFRIYKRDRHNHASPNSAHTEAVMAGALGVQLAGDAWYFGTLHKKKTIGDSGRPVEREDIFRAHRLMYGTAILSLIFMAGLRFFAAFCLFR